MVIHPVAYDDDHVENSQDAFTETYLTSQKPHVFSSVGVLIYVFDTESRHFHSNILHPPPSRSSTTSPASSRASTQPSNPDLETYAEIIAALHQYSPTAHVFCLIHKTDLIPADSRDKFLDAKAEIIESYSAQFKDVVRCYGTSIWDQTLYAAWGDIVQTLTPNLDLMEQYLNKLRDATNAEEVVLFERATFLRVLNVTTDRGEDNPYPDRFEKLSNLIKTFKHSLQSYTGGGDRPGSRVVSHPFGEFTISCPRFTLVIGRLTGNTYVLVVAPPGDTDLVNVRLNVMAVRDSLTEDLEAG